MIATNNDPRVDSLVLGPGFTIDVNLATRRAVLLGQPDVGKTNGLTVIAEGLLKLGVPTVILDWKGDLYGLRSSADGLRAGFPVVIFGGDHADVDVAEADGREIGHVVASEAMPAIIDLSGFEADAARRRFATAFLRAFLQAKASPDRQGVHTLLIDEYDEFAPERPYGDQVALLGAVQRCVGKGRKRGIGVIGTTVRTAQLAKSILELSDLYLFMQTGGRNDLKAIDDTLRRYASAEQLAEIRSAVPRLGKGEVMVYSPAWLRTLERHRFALRSTFDSSRTPEVGVKALAGPKAFAAVDAPALAARIAATREQREADDPDTLRARIVALERELDKNAKTVTTAAVVVLETRVRNLMIQRDRAVAVSRWLYDALRIVNVHARDSEATASAALEAADDEPAADQRLEIAPGKPAQGAVQDNGSTGISASRRPEGTGRPQDSHVPALPRAQDTSRIGAGEQKILIAIAQHRDGVTREQLSVLTGYKRSSRDTYLQRLRAAGLIADGATITATRDGIAVLGREFEPLPTGDALRRYWLERLPEGEGRVLEAVLRAYPRGVDRELISTATEYKRSSRDTYLQRLRSRQLVTVWNGGEIRASDTLFDSGSAR